MQIGDEDRERGPARSGFGPACRTGGIAALVFASAALLALALTGQRFQASATISFADGALQQIGDWRSEISKAEFGSSLAARLQTSDDWPGEAASFRQRLATLLDLDRARVVEDGSDLASRLDVGSDQGGTLTVTAEASDAQGARILAEAAAAELAERWSALHAPASMGGDGERAGARETRANLQHEAANAGETDVAPFVERLAALRAEEEELGVWIEADSTRLDRLRALEADPSAQIAPEENLLLADLEALRERRRALAVSIDGLAATLPAESPRLRIARLHLRELSEEMQADLAALVAGAEDQVRALHERDASLAGEIATLEETLLTLRAQNPASAVVGDAGSARSVPHPFVQVGLLAAFAGFAVGFAGSALKSFAGRRRRPVAEGDLAIQVGRGVEEDTDGLVLPPSGTVPFDEAEPAEITLDEAVAALSASSISRTLVAGIEGSDGSAASLRLARALARDGQLVLLVDLSPTQSVIAEAGVPRGSRGLGDVVSGAVGFASVTLADEGSGTDLVPAGRRDIEPSARNEALRFARRAYDQVVVECRTASAAELHALADENAAILLASNGSEPDTARSERLREFEAAGLEIAILLV